MRLGDFMGRERLSGRRMSKLIGVSERMVWRYAAGQCIPRWGVLARIAKVTGYKVMPDDFLKVRVADKRYPNMIMTPSRALH